MKRIARGYTASIMPVFCLLIGVCWLLSEGARAQSSTRGRVVPMFKLDPLWPKPLPNNWVTGELGGVCVDAQDHVFIVTRANLSPKERIIATPAPPVIEFDPDGNVVNTGGDRKLTPGTPGAGHGSGPHGCFFDQEGNFWMAGNHDAIVQKYTHDGSKMLLQIGTKGRFDSSDGLDSRVADGAPMNSSHVYLNSPTAVAVDPTNGDVYISDGYGNRRVVVFDHEGHYLRQWGRQGTVAEVDSGTGGVFLKFVHCIAFSNDGLVYVCDRQGDRVQVFDKIGNFKQNIRVPSDDAPPHTEPGTACWLSFSPEPAQKFMYVGDCTDNEIRILDRSTGQVLSSFGRPEFYTPHAIAVDSKGNMFIAEVEGKVHKFELVN
jgi:DNA-binding beta-propeller fold protein YncE